MDQIAIVDDSEINLALLKALVAKMPLCESSEFLSSMEGLQWCLVNKPDLIIVDYMMPELNGIDFIRQLRSSPATEEIPVLMITANDDRDVRYEALQSGATDFLNKPVDRIEFSARVRNMLALGNGRKRLANKAAWLADEVTKATAVIHAREQELLFRMSRAAEFRDPETGAHIQRIAHYSKLIARVVGMNDQEQMEIFQASPMHDIGKIGVPDYILLKPGRLTGDEWALMRRHATIGFELLNGSESRVLQVAADIALNHHERFDGSGYPHALSGQDIPLVGRIVAVADVFDALISPRPYKRAWSLTSAREYLEENSGKHFDPEFVRAFLLVWPEVEQIFHQFSDD